jgi:hypothetical protein
MSNYNFTDNESQNDNLEAFHLGSIRAYTYRNLTYPLLIHSMLIHDYNKAIQYFRHKTINSLLNE